jgi:hypothetical protein
LAGGLNENVSSLELGPGEMVSGSENYYISDGTTGGYRSIRGYERFDGHPSPSSVSASEADHAERDAARALIGQVPGAGDILGLFVFRDKVYVFRNKVDGLTAGMYVESPTGWIEIDTSTNPLNPNGSIESVEYNFLAQPTSKVVLWVDGSNQARMFDGTTITAIKNAGMGVNDTPTHLAVHQERLFLSYNGGSVQYSAVGVPNDWTTGAGEIGLGDDITSLTSNIGGTLLVTCEKSIKVLEGDSSLTWALKTFSDNMGSRAKTLNKIFDTVIFMSGAVVTTLSAAQEFGSFKSSTISPKVANTLRKYSQSASASVVIKSLNQYVLFFSNNEIFIFSFSGKSLKGVTRANYKMPVIHAFSFVDNNGIESFFFTSNTGFVYQGGVGTSFDGDPISYKLHLPFHHYGSPNNLKKFQRITTEIQSVSDMTISVGTCFNYLSPGTPRGIIDDIDLVTSKDSWGNGIWGEMIYSSPAAVNHSTYNLYGIGYNMGLRFSSESAFGSQHTIQNFITDYEVLGRAM